MNLTERTELRRHGGGLYEATIVRKVEVSPDRAWSIMSDLNNLDSVIPLCESSHAEVVAENEYELKIEVGLPWPIPRIYYVVTSKLDHDDRCVSWQVITGNLKRNDGFLRFHPILSDSALCVAEYQCVVGAGFYVPGFAERLVEALVIPSVTAGLIQNLSLHTDH